MHRFMYEGELAPGDEVALSPEESHHLCRVLRVALGEKVEVGNGRGALARAIVSGVAPKACRVQLESVDVSQARPGVVICFGVAKPASLEFTLKRCTEIGVRAFQPLVTQHSMPLSNWNEKRWSRIVLEVAKQCQELHFPEILPPKRLDAWLATRASGVPLVFCDEGERHAADSLPTNQSAYDLLVGAEGGWSADEVKMIRARGAMSFGLGKNRLRAEMAALVGSVLLKREIGELGRL